MNINSTFTAVFRFMFDCKEFPIVNIHDIYFYNFEVSNVLRKCKFLHYSNILFSFLIFLCMIEFFCLDL